MKTFRLNKSNLAAIIYQLNVFISEIVKKDKTYTIEIKEHREKRSLAANNYFWALCNKLAEAMSKKEVNISDIEIYKGYVRDCGVYTQFDIEEIAVKTILHSWGLHGLGWFGEIVDVGQKEGHKTIRLYYGSSTYNTKQMSRIIDLCVMDCKELGIETLTPNELSGMIKDWRPAV